LISPKYANSTETETANLEQNATKSTPSSVEDSQNTVFKDTTHQAAIASVENYTPTPADHPSERKNAREKTVDSTTSEEQSTHSNRYQREDREIERRNYGERNQENKNPEPQTDRRTKKK
jgi:hypothetical protein